MQARLRSLSSGGQVVCTTVVLLLASALLCAQLQLRGGVELVNVVATVVDGNGRTVPNLTIDDFIVEDDGQPQTIAHILPSADLPISIGVVLDASGSMQSKIRTAQRAIDRFFSRVQKDDEIFLMTFAARASVIADFTSDRTTLTNALMTGVNVGDGTSLYDSLYQALQLVKQGRNQKKVVLLVTDGEDTTSLTRIDKALQNIREADMLVYSVGIKGTPGFNMGASGSSRPDHPTVDMEVLKQFAKASGGTAWEISEASFGKNMDAVMDKIADELRSQYSIGYSPSNPVQDGKLHRVRVRMKNPDYRARGEREYVAATAFLGGTSGIKYAGRPLRAVLLELTAGLNILFSDEFVKPSMKVLTERKAVLARDFLDEILRPHKLQVRVGPNGALLIVRRPR